MPKAARMLPMMTSASIERVLQPEDVATCHLAYLAVQRLVILLHRQPTDKRAALLTADSA